MTPTAASTQNTPEVTYKVLLEWKSPMRPFKQLDKNNFKRLVLWAVLLALVLVFFREFVLALTLFALLFFAYVMGTVRPGEVKHVITENGVTSAEHTYLWSELKDYFFTNKLGEDILNIETKVMPAKLQLILRGIDKNMLAQIMSQKIPQREQPPYTMFDSLSEKAAQLLNLA